MSERPVAWPADLGAARTAGMVLDTPLALGEGALWDAAGGRFVCVDIKGGRILSWRPGSEVAEIRTPGTCGFALPAAGGGFLAGIGRALCYVGDDGAVNEIARVEDAGPIRINDGTLAPDGTVWFGTMDDEERAPLGHFFSWRAGRGLLRHAAGFVVTNGPAFAPDGTGYLTSSTDRVIHRTRLVGDGLAPPEPFVHISPDQGYPDGMAVDEDGHLWVAHWDGFRVTRFDPDGRVAGTLAVPTARVTKPAFGGPDRRMLYLTTAAIGRDLARDPLAGQVLAASVPVAGPATARVRVAAL